MKIIVLDGYTLNPGDLCWEQMQALGDCTIYERTPKDEIISRIGDAEIVITNKTPITKETLDACPHIQYIGVLATGYNVVDTVAAKEKGILVSNIPTYGTDAVAQYTIALLLEVCHHIGEHNRAVQDGAWSSTPDFCFWNYPLMELAGKTMGFIGFGHIGQSVAEIAKALKLNLLAYSPSGSKHRTDLVSHVSLDEIYKQADIITLHCPLTDDTNQMINKNSIAKMKDGVILLNTARGPLINEADLAEALNTKKVSFAALDVLSEEPITQHNPLLGLENCIVTPHIAWASKESRQRLMDMAVKNTKRFLAGKPQNIVNL